MRKMCKLLSVVAAVALAAVMCIINASAAEMAKLNETSVTLNVGQTYQLWVDHATEGIVWGTSNKNVATVSKGKVTAKKAGTATVTVRHGSTQLKCKVSVKENKKIVGKDVADLDITFSDKVNNDHTGKWKLAKTYKSADLTKFAVSYYQTYFKDDSEIHYIINYADNTTTVISVGYTDLYVSVYKHVSGEENDADKLPSGNVIAEYGVDISTGKVEKY